MDIVYPLGRQSLWQNQEIKFSLRSLEKHLKIKTDKVFIFGKKPDFFNEKVIEVPIEDSLGHKYFNVARKIGAILTNKEISDNFLYMNDDFFLLKDYEEIPYYYSKNLKWWIDNYPKYKGKYWKQIKEVYKYFPDGKFFEIHFPIIFNKQKAYRIYQKYNLSKVAVMLRSYYCNEYINEIEIKRYNDNKVYNHDEFVNKRGGSFISLTNVVATMPDVKNFLKSRFSKRSKYEK
jgi:hypothetical protein